MTYQFTTADIDALRAATKSRDEALVRKIAGAAAARAGMTLARVLGPDRSKPVVRVRDVICHAADAEHIGASCIGRVINRDHSSVLSAIRREKARRAAE